MNRQSPRLVVAAAFVTLVLVGSACGSSDNATTGSGAKPGDKAESSAAPDSGSSSGDEGSAGSDGKVNGTGTATPADGEAEPDKTVTYQDGGGFDKTTLKVGVGEKFTFVGGDKSVHAICVAGSDCLTVMGGLYETFTIDKPGTYEAHDDIDESTAMTITVS